MEKKFLDFLKDNVVLFDGAMGTELYRRGVFINTCFDELNISKPDMVKKIHKDYINAGANVIETNTFGANIIKLQKYGLEDKLAEINKEGVRIALEAADNQAYVAGAIGPLNEKLKPVGVLTKTEAKSIILQQSTVLVKSGVHLLIIETFTDLEMIELAICTIKENFDIPVIAQMTILNDGNTSYGTPPHYFAKRLADAGADCVGINCNVGPKIMLEAVEKITAVIDIPVSVMPNAGIPQNVEGRNIYLASPSYFGEYALRFIKAGARIIGGCCGTTPEFIKEMGKSIVSLKPGTIKHIRPVKDEEVRFVDKVKTVDKSSFARKIYNNEFVTTVEIVPPRGFNTDIQVRQAKKLKEAGVDAINIPDGPRALSRMGSSYLSLILQRDTEIEVIQHYTCRDRNLLGIMSDLLGAYAMGIRNLLIITGDPPKMGTYPDAAAVFDVDSIGLTSVIDRLNNGLDIGGNYLKQPTGFYSGVGVNPGAIDLKYEIDRFEQKVEAGAGFAITQPVFDNEIFFNFLKKTEHIKVPIIAGIWPLISIKNAEFMNNEVPGASVPEKIMQRLKKERTKEGVTNIGLQIARETIAELRPHIVGIQASMPFGKVQYPIKILKDIL